MAIRLSNQIRSNVVAYVALFFALSGGAAWATHPGGANTISSGDIINSEVKSLDLGDGEVKNDDLGVNAVGSAKINDRSVKNADLSIGASSSNTIADGGIQGVDVKNDTLTGGQVDESTLFNDNSLTGADIDEATLSGVPSEPSGPAGGDLTGTYPNPDIGDGKVTSAKLDLGAVTEAKLADLAVTIPKLAFDPATQTELDDHADSGAHDFRYWKLAGNAGTDPDTAFLGTSDNQPLSLRVNDARALRLEPASDGTNQSPNVIGGIADNSVSPGVHSATIAGGGRANPADSASANSVTDNQGTVGGGADNQVGDADTDPNSAPRATVGGGLSNTASGPLATVGGGNGNSASASGATVGGGVFNTASASDATVAGGASNIASGVRATVAGGSGNTASQFDSTVGGGFGNTTTGLGATVPGGLNNLANGVLSLAAGNRAKAHHQGAFVWADSQDANMDSTGGDQFIARAAGRFFLQSDSILDDQGGFLNTSTGGFLSTGGAWTNASDENLKSGFEPVEPRGVLERVAELPVRSWEYDAEPGVRHLGPTAQDFYRAFGLGADNRHIASVDANGVALAAIKGLERDLRAERRLRLKQERQFEARLSALERGGR